MVDNNVNCRGQFQRNGTLTNQIVSPGSSAVTAHFFPIFAISVDLGAVSAISDPLVWSVGMTRNPAIAFAGAAGSTQLLSPYWASEFNTTFDAQSC
ncbi:hypothetical protein EIP86_005883 [Pleurotus ostreatoroseus]|nr:hypothetical protein EIP86_005883 [Pleurotus ostreatoroseus]